MCILGFTRYNIDKSIGEYDKAASEKIFLVEIGFIYYTEHNMPWPEKVSGSYLLIIYEQVRQWEKKE